MQSIEKDEMGVKLIWSAMTIAYKDKPEEILPQVLPQNLAALEQDIIGPVYRLTRERGAQGGGLRPQEGGRPAAGHDVPAAGHAAARAAGQFSRSSAELLEQGHYEAVPIELTEDSPVPEDVGRC